MWSLTHRTALLLLAALLAWHATASPVANNPHVIVNKSQQRRSDSTAKAAKWQALAKLAGQDLVTLCQGIEPKATQTFTGELHGRVCDARIRY